MKRRNFLSGLIAVAFTPVIVPVAATPSVGFKLNDAHGGLKTVVHARGMTTCVFHVDECGYLCEDSIIIPAKMREAYHFKTYDKRKVEFGSNHYPINLYDHPPVKETVIWAR